MLLLLIVVVDVIIIAVVVVIAVPLQRDRESERQVACFIERSTCNWLLRGLECFYVCFLHVKELIHFFNRLIININYHSTNLIMVTVSFIVANYAILKVMNTTVWVFFMLIFSLFLSLCLTVCLCLSLSSISVYDIVISVVLLYNWVVEVGFSKKGVSCLSFD